jgi:hypothetical protein
MPVTINGTTGISGVDGSAGTPSIRGTDADSGVFYTSTGNVAISTGGTTRVLVDTTGQVTVSGSITLNGTALGSDPVGTIRATTNTTTPSGYLPCDGSVYLQSSYPALAAVCNVATFGGTYLANLRSLTYTSTLTGQLSPISLSATSDGLVFFDLINQGGGLGNAYVTFDSGSTWSTLRANVRVSTPLTAKSTIAYNGTNYVAANTGATNDHTINRGVRYGSNVLTGMATHTTTNFTKIMSSVVWTGTNFIAVGYHPASTASDANVASISTDGVTWTLGGQIANLSSAISSTLGEKYLAYGNNTLVVVAANAVSSTNNFTSTIMRYSTDNATSWTTITQPSGFGVNSSLYTSGNSLPIIAVTFANNQFVAVDFAGAVANSPNGIVWRTIAPARTLNAPSSTVGLTVGTGTARQLSDVNPHQWSQGVSYTSKAGGYYIINNSYSTDLVTWKRFPQLVGTEVGFSIPAGAGVIQPSSNNYFFSGSYLYSESDGSTTTYYYSDPGVLNMAPNLGTQFNVPYLTDEQGAVVRYYIKT